MVKYLVIGKALEHNCFIGYLEEAFNNKTEAITAMNIESTQMESNDVELEVLELYDNEEEAKKKYEEAKIC